MFPLAAEHHLEVRHRVARHFAAHAIESEVGDVVLPAAIEAAADFDVQVLHGFVELEALLGEPLAQLGRKPARRRNPQLARVRAGARNDIDDRAGAGHAKLRGLERFVERGQVGLADPANREILLDRGANRFLREFADDIGERAKLRRGDVAERQRRP